MALHHRFSVGVGAALLLISFVAASANAQDAPSLRPIPAEECEQFATRIQDASGFAMKAAEDDFTDLTDDSEGRSCHIAGSASDQAFAGPPELTAKIATVFAGWRDDLDRAAEGPDGAENGYVSGNRIATVNVSWEPGPGVVCSDKESLSACKILPQQKLWNVVVDIVEKPGK
jgi:hypothetical protein